jgi:hypothetical protein
MKRKERHIDAELSDYLQQKLDQTTRKGDYYIRSGRGKGFSIEVFDKEKFKTLVRFPDSGTVNVKRDKHGEIQRVIFQGLQVPISVGQSEDSVTREEMGEYFKNHGINGTIIFLDQRNSDDLPLKFTHDIRQSLKRER